VSGFTHNQASLLFERAVDDKHQSKLCRTGPSSWHNGLVSITQQREFGAVGEIMSCGLLSRDYCRLGSAKAKKIHDLDVTSPP
jgi:hypothetical protein